MPDTGRRSASADIPPPTFHLQMFSNFTWNLTVDDYWWFLGATVCTHIENRDCSLLFVAHACLSASTRDGKDSGVPHAC